MIEQQTIDGRPARLTYITFNFEPATPDKFDLVKVVWDDGESAFLVKPYDDGEDEAAAWASHRAKHAAPLDEGAAEGGGFSRHREKHRRVNGPAVSTGEIPEHVAAIPARTGSAPHVPSEDRVEGVEPTKPKPEMPVAHQLAAWAKAVVILDGSEVLVRDVIERELSNVEFLTTNEAVNGAVQRVMDRITEVRTAAIKTAFLVLRDHLGDHPIANVSMSRWAATFLRMDLQGIEMAVRAAIVEGLDGQEIARKVVGTMGLNGVDGVTEFTRLKVAHLGRTAIRESNLRKRGIENA